MFQEFRSYPSIPIDLDSFKEDKASNTSNSAILISESGTGKFSEGGKLNEL